MAEFIRDQDKNEITLATALRVVCDGPSFSRHPRVFLAVEVDDNGALDRVVCPYCSRVFVYKDSASARAALDSTR